MQNNNNDFDCKKDIHHYNQKDVKAFCSLLKNAKGKINADLYKEINLMAMHHNWVKIKMVIGRTLTSEVNETLNELYLAIPR